MIPFVMQCKRLGACACKQDQVSVEIGQYLHEGSSLGDFLAFLLSHGAAPRGGSSRLLALAFDVIQQVGQQLQALLQRNCDENLF